MGLRIEKENVFNRENWTKVSGFFYIRRKTEQQDLSKEKKILFSYMAVGSWSVLLWQFYYKVVVGRAKKTLCFAFWKE